MFKNLTNFGYTRSIKEAFVFYIAYLLFIIASGAIAGGTAAMLLPAFDPAYIGGRAGLLISVLIVGSIVTLTLKEKKLYTNLLYIILALLSVLLASLFGGLGGLVIPAYFTTLAKKESLSEV